jgi:hypothetical protein
MDQITKYPEVLQRAHRSSSLFLHHKASDNQRVHTRTEEFARGIRQRIHDRLTAPVEESVHQDWYARTLSEFVDQTPI